MNSPPDRATTPDTPSNANDKSPAGVAAPPKAAHRIQSHEVMRGQSAVAIEHNGNVYRLQTTRQGKLILTK
ncbi:hemin uptake protein HemP [Hydrogenophaga sp. PAMC20947]|uniref:hemin uptake protein HemP n=1 Tax=Hydrogenophaga sp. PAMC20947 TaxID=2565558 RepID=UPI00109DC9B7|nr:hemin uptake protein HemP [Hydrogenophaga sp. PAMC20947]QCB45835.1 hemin uptake protein HemP [Hydrogenophaga sp. PAMC20947]